jgi:hypothetical protein
MNHSAPGVLSWDSIRIDSLLLVQMRVAFNAQELYSMHALRLLLVVECGWGQGFWVHTRAGDVGC